MTDQDMSEYKRVQRNRDGEVQFGYLIGEFYGNQWVKPEGHYTPLTYGPDTWTEVVDPPKIGEKWTHDLHSPGYFRVLGVDEERGVWYMGSENDKARSTLDRPLRYESAGLTKEQNLQNLYTGGIWARPLPETKMVKKEDAPPAYADWEKDLLKD